MNDRRTIEEMLARDDFSTKELNNSLFLTKRNACGKIPYADGTEAYDIIELLHLEKFKDRVHYNLPVERFDEFIPMYESFFLTKTESPWVRTRQSPEMGYEGRCTIGAGIYYCRTNYEIHEDENYNYIVSTFDIYTNNLFDNAVELYNGVTPAYYYRGTEPRHIEADTGLSRFYELLKTAPQNTGSTGSTRQVVRHNLTNLERLWQWKSEHRLPEVRRHAMDTSRDNISVTRNGLTACVAIRKGFNPAPGDPTAEADRSLGDYELTKRWFGKSTATERLLSMRKRPVYLNETRIVTTTNSLTKKKSDKMFQGILARQPSANGIADNPFAFAQIFTTNSNEQSGQELLRLLKNRLSPKNYPETQKKVLLKAGAFVGNNPPGTDIIRIDHVLTSAISLVRKGDCNERIGGRNLYDFCRLNDAEGVFELTLPNNATLRLDKKVATLDNGIYKVCVTEDVTDIIQYLSTIRTAFGSVTVEIKKGRLNLETGSVNEVRRKRRARIMSPSTNTTPTSRRTRYGRFRLGSAFGLLGKENKTDENE
jgi:hypothetical protein